DLWHAFRASNASRGTSAAAQARWGALRARRRCNDLRAPSWIQRIHGSLGWAWHHAWSGWRCVFERLAQSPRDSVRACHDCGVANDFRHCAIALDWICGRGKSLEVSLERGLGFLSAVSRGNRIRAHLFASLLVVAANDCGEATGNLAHYSTWCGRIRLGSWRGDIFSVVAFWRVLGARRSVDDLSKGR